ncbi:23S rRNA (uracil(1939)-C(5))-methyltransferase RlmD [Agarivorans sp.]|uniref:23S rRNA (uracil(1939)-C(5))-methyltransferase RlmD n=1 Tax=Agarivorans sp. TaxID=1872412 RepID=UPI003CFE146C
MAQFFKAKPKTTTIKALRDQQVLDLDHHLKGVVKCQGQTYFVDGVLPGERVDILPSAKSGPAKLLKRLSSSPERIEPACGFYQQCGGCSAQHLSVQRQRDYKQQAVTELLSRLSTYSQLPEIDSLFASEWAYRRVCRLSSWFDKNAGWQLGFRQKASKNLVAVSECPVLEPQLSALIAPLQTLVSSWPKKVGLGHIELIACQPQTVCRIRLTQDLNPTLQQQLLEFAQAQQLAIVLASNDQQSWLCGDACYYSLDEQGLNLGFTPGNFIQVNGEMNQRLVSTALDWLDLQANDSVLDLYSGIGNFSLAIAQQVKQLVAVEGLKEMAQQVTRNAIANGLSNVVAFSGDLEQPDTAQLWQGYKINKVLLDPARAGAKQAITQVAKLSPSTVVYVSCNPATLARDAREMKQAGYRLTKLALVDMFAHTEHIETMALFER